jgi:iron complex outermembrane receptor protein
VKPLLVLNAVLFASALAVPANAAIETVIVTAEKRAVDVQTVPVAISVFTSEKRDAVGINTIADMTNFTPGLAYYTSLDRIFLRGVGRQTNSQAADTPVANYDDGLFETFAVAAGRSSLELDRVEVLRGPQGTLSGRNALAGALNQITRHPQTDEFHGEARLAYGAFNHLTAEAELTGPLDDVWSYRLYVIWDKQTRGWSNNIVPNEEEGAPDPLFTGRPNIIPVTFGNAGDGNVIDEYYADFQIQAKFNTRWEMWTKLQTAQWWNGAGGPGADLEGWTPADYPTYEAAQGGLYLNAGYGCTAVADPSNPYFTANTTVNPGSVVSPLPAAQICDNPSRATPWRQARVIQTKVRLPSYFSANTQWTYHADGFDVKYIGGGSYYRYHLSTQLDVHWAPITSYNVGTSHIDNRWTFNPEEENSFISNEINVISTAPGDFQWVVGAYQFSQQANQPGDAFNPNQPEVNGNTPGHPFGDAFLGTGGFPPTSNGSVFCSSPGFLGGNGTGTGGVCAPWNTFRTFDTRNNIHAKSYAGFGQIDWQATEEFKVTLGARYTWDHKYGSETARVVCYYGFCSAFGATPELASIFPYFGRPIDTTQTGIVVNSGVVETPPFSGIFVNALPQGVVAPTIYDPNTGFATRFLDSKWDGITGTAGVEWQPDDDTLAYAKYSRGYKDGGYYEGANTALVAAPFTDAEHVDSVEVGIKRTWDQWLTTNIAAFHYQYQNLQLPLTFINRQGVVTLNQTSFFNVPASISQGIELELNAQPTEDLAILFNYSYNDAHITRGAAFDPADPNALEPGATPLYSDLECFEAATDGNPATNLCSADNYTFNLGPYPSPGGTCAPPVTVPPAVPPPGLCPTGGLGWNKPQNLKGNKLPNAAPNKIAVNVMYTFHTDIGTITPSVSYFWRDKQYGTLFTRSYNESPSWNQIDARIRFVSDDDQFEVIVYGKNIFNDIAYETGGIATRLAGSNYTGIGCIGINPNLLSAGGCNFVQGLNGPAGYGHVRGSDATGHVTAYQVAPPALWGVEFHWKFD